MDGQACLYRIRQSLSEDANSAFLDDRTSYEYLWQAAIEFVERTDALKSSQSITLVADQTDYTLNADFLELYLQNSNNNLVIKYSTASTHTFLPWKSYEDMVLANNTTSVTTPESFTILSDSADSQISSTTTSAGAATAGLSTLTDTGEDFADVSAGDIVHNVTDGSTGYVTTKTSSTVLVTALFGGTDDDWTSGDSYIIQPQARYKLVIDPPPSQTDTLTVYYVQRPAPVMSAYGVYNINSNYHHALCSYAAWFYKYKDREPNFGDAWYRIFMQEVGRANVVLGNGVSRSKLKISFKKG